MTVRGGSSPACAACKHQRRKCSSDCALAPYFPANQTNKFLNVHRLFGLSNIQKTLKQIDDEDKKADAMKSIIFEADMRTRFPVHGCLEYIHYLRDEIQKAEEELRSVRTQLHEQTLVQSINRNDNDIGGFSYPWDKDNPIIGNQNPVSKKLFGLDPVSCFQYKNVSSVPIFLNKNIGDHFSNNLSIYGPNT